MRESWDEVTQRLMCDVSPAAALSGLRRGRGMAGGGIHGAVNLVKERARVGIHPMLAALCVRAVAPGQAKHAALGRLRFEEDLSICDGVVEGGDTLRIEELDVPSVHANPVGRLVDDAEQELPWG